jgi:hypothetical protein
MCCIHQGKQSAYTEHEPGDKESSANYAATARTLAEWSGTKHRTLKRWTNRVASPDGSSMTCRLCGICVHRAKEASPAACNMIIICSKLGMSRIIHFIEPPLAQQYGVASIFSR